LKPGKDNLLICPESNFKYREISPGILTCLDLNEEEPLPNELSQGIKGYDEFKK